MKFNFLTGALAFDETVELATSAETITGTVATKATTPAGVKAAIDLAIFAAGSYDMASDDEAIQGVLTDVVTNPAQARQRDWTLQHRISVPWLDEQLAKMSNGTAAIASFLVLTDSYGPTLGFSGANTVNAKLYRAFGGFRGVFAGANTATEIYTDAVTGGTTRTSPGSSPNYAMPNGCVFSLPTGGAVELGTQATEWGFNKATFVYKLGVTGTFKLQYRISNYSAWVDVTTIDTTSGTGLATSVITMPALTAGSGTFVRALNLTGTSIIGGALLENTNITLGVIISNLAIGGLGLTGGGNTCPSANMTTLLALLVPNVVLTAFDDTDVTTCYPALHTLWDGARSGMSWVHAACHNDSLDNAATRNPAIISFCQTNGYQWFDVRSVIPTYAFAVAMGWQLDTGHLNSDGWQVAAKEFWRSWPILKDLETTFPHPVNNSSVASLAISQRGTSLDKLRNGAALFAAAGARGFTVSTTNNAQVSNRTAFTALSSGDPFAIAAYVTLPVASNVYSALFATHATVTNSYSANNVDASLETDGTLRVNFFQGTTSDGWRMLYSSAQVAPYRGLPCLVWLWRNAAGVIRFGINDQEMDPAQGTATFGSGTVSPTQLVSAEYCHFGRGNNNTGETTRFGPCVFWAADVDPRLWWQTGKPPGTPTALYYFPEGAGDYAHDASGNGNDGKLTDATSWTFPAPQATASTVATGAATANIGAANIANSGSRLTFTLPAAPKLGDSVEVIGLGSGGWKVGQPASTQIVTGLGNLAGTNATTAGTSGYVQSGARYDAITLRCITSDTVTPSYVWSVKSSAGTLTWN